MKKFITIIGIALSVLLLSGCELLNDPELVCDSGYEVVEGACEALVPDPVVCGDGEVLNEDTNECELEEPDPVVCGEGEVLNQETNECEVVEPLVCENGYHEENGECVVDTPSCIPGYVAEDGVCVKVDPVCEEGEVIVNGECATETTDSCPPGMELLAGYCFDLDHPEYLDMGYEEYAGRDIVTDSCSHLDNIGEWQPVWCDEFEYTGLPNSSLWYFETGGHGWGNGESQYYTSNDLDNAVVRDGNLIITAIKEEYAGNDYTSVRLNSKSGNWTYGKIQVRAILPTGRGTWPAIWMLSTDWEYGGWPESGEIDIMEYVGYDVNRIHSTVHTKAYYHSIGTQVGQSTTIIGAEKYYHVYEIEWEPGLITSYVDGRKYFTYEFDPEDNIGIETFKAWPFDIDFHLLLNIAVGGAWGGAQGIDDSIFPTSMAIDYVRVYQKDYAGMDQSAPEAVGNLRVLQAKQTEFYLGWDVAVDDVMIEKYEIYIDDVLTETSTVNGFLITGLSPETEYNVKVKAIDFAGNESPMAEITASTLMPPTTNDRIEAELYSNQAGTDTEDTSDSGGGQNVGWVDIGDFLEYEVDVLEAGQYTITFRVAAESSSNGFNVLVDGQNVATVAISGTGGWQSWTNVTTAPFSLTTGSKTFKLQFIGNGININYFEFNKVN